jgi:peptidoglycan hydrolase-like protein with peptidoglycan-binding domain
MQMPLISIYKPEVVMFRTFVAKLSAAVLAAMLLLQPLTITEGFAANSKTSSAPTFTRTLKLGCSGADVQTLQQRLKTLGYFKATVTTKFGSITRTAVKAFQKANKLAADGIVGRTTFAKLYPANVTTPTTTAAAASSAAASAAPSASAATQYGRLQNQTTLKPGNSGADVKDLQLALTQKGFYSGSITGKFDAATKTAIMKFQRSVGLETDGLAGNYTLSALYSLLQPVDLNSIKPWPVQAAQWAALPVEKLTWAQASVNPLPRGTNAVVVDVATGYSFNIRRTGGTLHADVETLTTADTAAFFKAAGSTFTWNRHPIWVIVGNRRLAASMNCMPHGYDSIAGNDMKGQFCIHFVGSRTHGTNKVDPDHQKAIEVAFTTTMVVPVTTTAAATTSAAAATVSPTLSASETPVQSIAPASGD